MKKKIKSAVISIGIISVLLLSILIGVKNGTIDKLTKEMPTLETKQEQTNIQNENQNNTGNDSAREENLSKRDVAYIGQQFELRDDDIRYKYDENNRKTYNVFYISVRTVNISRECNFDVNRIRFGLDDKKDSIDADYNFISDYYYAMIELEVTKDINDNDIILDNDNEFHTLWYSVKLNEDGTYNKIENYENVGISSDNTHGNVHLEKGETKTITLYYLITDEEFENEILAIDFYIEGSPCKGTLAIIHEPEANQIERFYEIVTTCAKKRPLVHGLLKLINIKDTLKQTGTYVSD